MTNYNDMQSLLVQNEGFRGNSVDAIRVNRANGTFSYSVHSYATLIYSYDSETNESFFNNAFYSMTTSKIQNMLIRAYNLNNGVQKRS